MEVGIDLPVTDRSPPAMLRLVASKFPRFQHEYTHAREAGDRPDKLRNDRCKLPRQPMN